MNPHRSTFNGLPERSCQAGRSCWHQMVNRAQRVDSHPGLKVLSRMPWSWIFLVSLLLCVPKWAVADEKDFEQALASVLRVDADPVHQPRVADAWLLLVNSNEQQVIKLLRALDAAGPMAANWIRPAIDAALERLEGNDQMISEASLREIAMDVASGPRGRALAIRELQRVYPSSMEQLEPKMLNDPVAAFRQPAIKRLLARAADAATSADERRILLRQAWDATRDEIQCLAIKKQLEELDEVADPRAHFGWLTRWFVAGPFEDEENQPHETIFPLEHDLPTADSLLKAHAQAGANQDPDGSLSWKPFAVENDQGELDFNQLLGKHKGVAAFAAAIIESGEQRDVQIRLRQQNAFKMWLNGALVVDQPIGHTGNAFDQYTYTVRLNPGNNLLVIKSSQIHPPMAHPFFETWHASARVCDTTGGAIAGVGQPELPPTGQS